MQHTRALRCTYSLFFLFWLLYTVYGAYVQAIYDIFYVDKLLVVRTSHGKATYSKIHDEAMVGGYLTKGR